MDNVNDFIKALSERTSSPVSGTFTIAWLLLNWKIPLFIIFGSSNQNRVDLISEYLHTCTYNELLLNPALVTAIYIPTVMLLKLLYTYVETKFEYWTQKRKLEISEVLRQESQFGATLFKMNQDLYTISNGSINTLAQIRKDANEILSDRTMNDKTEDRVYKIINICERVIKHQQDRMLPFTRFNASEYIEPPIYLKEIDNFTGQKFKLKAKIIWKIIWTK